MTGNSLDLLQTLVASAAAGSLMLLAGTQKKLLRLKQRTRCAACGRSGDDCTCSR